jgi:hypothetical protein
MTPARMTTHLVDRYLERVDPSTTRHEARRRLNEFLRCGKARVTPRHWMAEVRPGPGKQFVFWSEEPGVCIVVVDGAAVTLLTRQLVRTGGTPRRFRPDRRRLEPVDRWRWDGTSEDEPS